MTGVKIHHLADVQSAKIGAGTVVVKNIIEQNMPERIARWKNEKV